MIASMSEAEKQDLKSWLCEEYTLALYQPLALFHYNTIQTFLSLKPPAWKYLADENTTADAKIENPQNNFKPR